MGPGCPSAGFFPFFGGVLWSLVSRPFRPLFGPVFGLVAWWLLPSARPPARSPGLSLSCRSRRPVLLVASRPVPLVGLACLWLSARRLWARRFRCRLPRQRRASVGAAAAAVACGWWRPAWRPWRLSRRCQRDRLLRVPLPPRIVRPGCGRGRFGAGRGPGRRRGVRQWCRSARSVRLPLRLRFPCVRLRRGARFFCGPLGRSGARRCCWWRRRAGGVCGVGLSCRHRARIVLAVWSARVGVLVLARPGGWAGVRGVHCLVRVGSRPPAVVGRRRVGCRFCWRGCCLVLGPGCPSTGVDLIGG